MSIRPRSLVLGLLIIFSYLFCAVADYANAPPECCFSFYTSPIHPSLLTKYEESDPNCSRAGVVFTIKKGVRVCVDPSFKWVKRAMDIIDRRTEEGLDSTQLSG